MLQKKKCLTLLIAFKQTIPYYAKLSTLHSDVINDARSANVCSFVSIGHAAPAQFRRNWSFGCIIRLKVGVQQA